MTRLFLFVQLIKGKLWLLRTQKLTFSNTAKINEGDFEFAKESEKTMSNVTLHKKIKLGKTGRGGG